MKIQPREIQVTKLVKRNDESTAKYVINKGGSGSSKTTSLCQMFIRRFINRQNYKLLITRKTLPSLKISNWKLFEDLITDYGYYYQCYHNKSDRIMTLGSNFIHYTGMDDPEKVKSTDWNDIWMEEATDNHYNDWKLLRLYLRAKGEYRNQMYLSFNPKDEQSWINQKLIQEQSDVEVIHSTWEDNPFLDEDTKQLLLKLKEEDPNFYKIYTLGEWGSLVSGLIYTNWVSVNEVPDKVDESIYGLDFGFNNPSALLRISDCDQNLYWDQLLYESHLTNSDLIEKMNGLIPDKRTPIYCDNGEPQRIAELRRAGFNAKESDKSVKDGINYIKTRKNHVTRRSTDLLTEKNTYKWKEDKDGNVYDEPVKFKDHALDGGRYAIYTRWGKIRHNKITYFG